MGSKQQRIKDVRDEMQDFLQGWQVEGGNLSEYCRKHGQDYNRAKSWKARLGFPKLRERKKDKSKPSGFIAVPAVAPPAVTNSFFIEVLLTDGTQLRFTSQVSTEYLRALLKG